MAHVSVEVCALDEQRDRMLLHAERGRRWLRGKGRHDMRATCPILSQPNPPTRAGLRTWLSGGQGMAAPRGPQLAAARLQRSGTAGLKENPRYGQRHCHSHTLPKVRCLIAHLNDVSQRIKGLLRQKLLGAPAQLPQQVVPCAIRRQEHSCHKRRICQQPASAIVWVLIAKVVRLKAGLRPLPFPDGTRSQGLQHIALTQSNRQLAQPVEKRSRLVSSAARPTGCSPRVLAQAPRAAAAPPLAHWLAALILAAPLLARAALVAALGSAASAPTVPLGQAALSPSRQSATQVPLATARQLAAVGAPSRAPGQSPLAPCACWQREEVFWAAATGAAPRCNAWGATAGAQAIKIRA